MPSAAPSQPATPGPRLAGRPISRRGLLVGAATGAAAVVVAACADRLPNPTSGPSASAAAITPSPEPTPSPTPAPTRTPTPTAATTPEPAARRRILYRDGALTDARSATLQVGVSILVEDGVIRWIRPSDSEADPGPGDGLEIVDASGTTFVPGMVDGHSHLTLPGGAHWIDRGFDPPAVAVAVAERNAALQSGSGVRWARDVGSITRPDPIDGRVRGLALGVRDRWRASGSRAYPYVRAAGSWIARPGILPGDLALEARNADDLLALALKQLDDGADFVKLYLDGPDRDVSPWTRTEIKRVVDAVHGRGARVTAHSGRLAGARAGVAGGVDALEHGFELDAAVCADMAARGTFVVSTLAVMASWLTFNRTTTIARFATASGRATVEARLERAVESIRLAKAAGVKIAAGTDFGGGSPRANQMAWEVGALVGAGLEPWEALAAATWRGGELLGEPDGGAIREGGPADFFLVHGDPVSDPSAVWRVWRVAWLDGSA
jgi:imidazolonepropionase-like amidohydrolase